jgi:hypothetical protein
LFLFFVVLFLTLFLIFLAALVSHYVSPFPVVQNIFSQLGFCCNRSIYYHLTLFSKSVKLPLSGKRRDSGIGKTRANSLQQTADGEELAGKKDGERRGRRQPLILCYLLIVSSMTRMNFAANSTVNRYLHNCQMPKKFYVKTGSGVQYGEHRYRIFGINSCGRKVLSWGI